MNQTEDDEKSSLLDKAPSDEDSSTSKRTLVEETNTVSKNMVQDVEHPTMIRLLDGLKNQLQQSYQRSKLALVDQEKVLRTLQKEREDVGVELYEMQKQLSMMQSSRNELRANQEKAAQRRKSNDSSIHDVRKTLIESQEALSTYKKQRIQLQGQVDEILESLRLANTWNQDLKHEVAVSRRSALKTEDIVRDLEKNKQSQDLFVDQLHQQIKALDSNIILLTDEKEAQCQETKEAKEAFLSTKNELERLTSEKKQLIQQWSGAILSRNRREKALSECRRAFQEKQDTLTEAIREISLLRQDLAAVNDETKALILNKSRLETEFAHLQGEMEKLRGNIDSTASEFEIVRYSIANTQERQLKMEHAKNKIEAEVTSTSHKIELVLKERQQLEISIQHQKNDQSLLTNEVSGLIDETRAIEEKIRDKELANVTVQNDIARVKVTTIDTQGHIEQLQEELTKELKLFQSKESLIVKMEGMIRKTHDEIVSKMKSNDMLNQAYSKMMSQMEEPEPLGPLEATIKSLKTNNYNESTEIETLQKQWFGTQEAIMTITNEVENEQSQIRDQSLKLDILKNQSLRLAQICHKIESEQKSFDQAIKGMQLDTSKLNEFIDKIDQASINVSNDIIVINQDKERVLREIQDEIARIELELNERKNSKRMKLDDILEQERQILNWEKMIRLEKDTKAALTTSDPAFQVKGMEKEINRMNIRLSKLKRKEDTIVREIELEMQKKDDLLSRCSRDVVDEQSSHFRPVTVAVLEKKSQHIKSQIQCTKEEWFEINARLIDAEQASAALCSTIAKLNKDCIHINDQISGVKNDLAILEIEKNRLFVRHKRAIM